MTDEPRVGILGAGLAGTGHATAFSQLPNVEVVALWSRTRSRAEALVAKLQVPNTHVYDSWQELVEQADVQVVTIATPEFLRREPLAMALERGCHVLVEKPLGIELEEAQELVRLAENADAVTATCYVWRYAPGTQAAWQAMQAGRIGGCRAQRRRKTHVGSPLAHTRRRSARPGGDSCRAACGC